jgi:hypothetical protein
MPIVFADRVKVRTRTSGTGSLTLENTVDGFQSFEAIGNGNQTYYGIEHPNGTWEIGLGTYNSSSSALSRDSIISSSNSNSLVNFAAGSKTVFVTIPSSVAANIIASTTFAFRDIAVSGQTTVEADSTTDTLTLVAAGSIGITTDANTDTITITGNPTDRLVNGLDEIVANVAGGITFPNSSIQRDIGEVACLGNASTIVYTVSAQYQHTIKLLIQVEGDEGANTDWDTQSCEMIIAKSLRANDIAATVYGVVHTSVAPLATFTADWNALTSRVEVVCTTPSANSVTVRIFATEISTSD